MFCGHVGMFDHFVASNKLTCTDVFGVSQLRLCLYRSNDIVQFWHLFSSWNCTFGSTCLDHVSFIFQEQFSWLYLVEVHTSLSLWHAFFICKHLNVHEIELLLRLIGCWRLAACIAVCHSVFFDTTTKGTKVSNFHILQLGPVYTNMLAGGNVKIFYQIR